MIVINNEWQIQQYILGICRSCNKKSKALKNSRNNIKTWNESRLKTNPKHKRRVQILIVIRLDYFIEDIVEIWK